MWNLFVLFGHIGWYEKCLNNTKNGWGRFFFSATMQICWLVLGFAKYAILIKLVATSANFLFYINFSYYASVSYGLHIYQSICVLSKMIFQTAVSLHCFNWDDQLQKKTPNIRSHFKCCLVLTVQKPLWIDTWTNIPENREMLWWTLCFALHLQCLKRTDVGFALASRTSSAVFWHTSKWLQR